MARQRLKSDGVVSYWGWTTQGLFAYSSPALQCCVQTACIDRIHSSVTKSNAWIKNHLRLNWSLALSSCRPWPLYRRTTVKPFTPWSLKRFCHHITLVIRWGNGRRLVGWTSVLTRIALFYQWMEKMSVTDLVVPVGNYGRVEANGSSFIPS